MAPRAAKPAGDPEHHEAHAVQVRLARVELAVLKLARDLAAERALFVVDAVPAPGLTSVGATQLQARSPFRLPDDVDDAEEVPLVVVN